MTAPTETLPRQLSAADSVAWRIEHNPLLRSTITLVLLLDGPVDRAALLAKIDDAIVGFPRLRQRVVSIPLNVAPPVWSADPDFDIDYHVRFIRASGDRTPQSVRDLAASYAMQAFDRARPLWEWTVVEDLEGGGSAFIIKIHHSVTDGVGGMQLMAQVFDLERNPQMARATTSTPADVDGIDDSAPVLLLRGVSTQAWRGVKQTRRSARQLLGLARRPMTGGGAAMRNVASTARLVAPARGPLSTVMTERSPRYRFESFTVSVADLKTAARRIDGKLNDAYMTALAIGLRKYHEVHGESPTSLRVNMPINLRGANDVAGGNNWAPARFVVPLDGATVDDHMREMQTIVAAQRAEPALHHANVIATVLDKLPTPVLTQMFSGMLTCLDFAATNVPGAPVPLYVAGARVDAMDAFAPPSGAAVNFALLSYQGVASVAMNIDPAAVADIDVLVACVREGFDEVISPPQRRRRK